PEELEHLARLMEKIDIAMLTTRGGDGRLYSRPLSTQCADFDGERVWFMTSAATPKVAEIEQHPAVNVAYASADADACLPVAGRARVVRHGALRARCWTDARNAYVRAGKGHPDLLRMEGAGETGGYWAGPGSWVGEAAAFAVARVTRADEALGENRIVHL